MNRIWRLVVANRGRSAGLCDPQRVNGGRWQVNPLRLVCVWMCCSSQSRAPLERAVVDWIDDARLPAFELMLFVSMVRTEPHTIQFHFALVKTALTASRYAMP
jgi:hypothetical protein